MLVLDGLGEGRSVSMEDKGVSERKVRGGNEEGRIGFRG
jgi:hypothetical protein